MNRKNQVLATLLSLLLSVGMSAGSILPTFAMENEGNTEVQTDVNASGSAEQSGEAVQEQKKAMPEAQSSSKSVKANSADEEEGEGEEGSDNPYVTGIEISEKNFPDKGFREYVRKSFDSNEDGWIKDDELDNAGVIELEYPQNDEEDEDGNEGESKSDTEYIELLESIKNINGAELLPNLQQIRINLNVALKDINDMDFSKFKQLNTVEITCHTKGSYYDGEHNKTLKKINLSNCKFNLDTSGSH